LFFELDVIAYLLPKFSSIDTEVQVGTNNLDIVIRESEEIVFMDVKAYNTSGLEQMVQRLRSDLSGILCKYDIQDYVFDLDISGDVRQHHFEDELYKSKLEQIKSEIEAGLRDGSLSNGDFREWKIKENTGIKITFKKDFIWLRTSSSLDPNMKQSLRQRILSSPNQFHSNAPNIRVIAKRRITRGTLDNDFLYVLGGDNIPNIEVEPNTGALIVRRYCFIPGIWYTSDRKEKAIAEKISGVMYYDYDNDQVPPQVVYFSNPNAKHPVSQQFLRKLSCRQELVREISTYLSTK